MSYTYAILPVSKRTFDEIKAKLEKVGYLQAFHDEGIIDMRNLALQIDADEKPYTLRIAKDDESTGPA